MTKINTIPETTQVVPGKSIADQIVDLPVGSVVLIKQGRSSQGLSTVLHRTGSNGWLSTRPLAIVEPKRSSRYYGKREIHRAIAIYEDAGAEFTLVDETVVP